MYRDELFIAEGGVRQSAIKILIVITDGRSNDGPHLRGAVEKAEKKNIIRFAFGVISMHQKRMQNHTKSIIKIVPQRESIQQITLLSHVFSIKLLIQYKIFVYYKKGQLWFSYT